MKACATKRNAGARRRAGALFLALALLARSGAAQSPAPAGPDYAGAFHRGDYAGARALASERLKAQPADVQAQILLARAEAALGRFDVAYAGFRKALRSDPRSVDALYYLGLTAGALAQAEYDRLMAVAPASARAHQVRGRSLAAQGRGEEAEAEYRAALAAGPPSADVQVALGDLRRTQSDFAGASESYSRAIELAPRDYDALYGAGACQSFEGHHAQAIELFRRALAVAPDSAPARLALGISLLQTRQAAAAAVELEQAARLEPRMRQAHYQLGRAYQALGRAQDAGTAFARAQELQKTEHEAAQAILEGTPAAAAPPP